MFSTQLSPYIVSFENTEEFHYLKQEIFTQNCYFFETDQANPFIIDAGAHIGLATLYFKKLFPQAKILAIEPNPATFQILEKNVSDNFLENVSLYQVGLAHHDDGASLFFDSTESSTEKWLSTASFLSGSWTGTQATKAVFVPTAPLAKFLTEPIDFLKLDIEGAEQRVLLEAGPTIRCVRQLLIEFHPTPYQSLTKIIEFLRANGFRYEIETNENEQKSKLNRGLQYIRATNCTQ